jgi:N-acetylglucosamine-6-phosphate deacetylase
MQQPFAINRIQIYENGQAIPDSLVVIDQGKILFAGRPEDAPGLDAMQMMDGRGLSVAPGYIDLQFNGGYGQDFTANPASLLDVAKHLPGTGVVAFLPTFITSPLEAYSEILQEVIKAQAFQNRASNSGARILGAHIEGPFLSPNKKGAHPQDLFRDPLPAALAYLEPLEVVRLLTLAPEQTGALDAIRWLTQQGIVVSIGHSAAVEHETLEAISAGASYATHLYNAMRSMQHRDPGLVGTLLTSNEVTCGLIVDGIHVHPRMVKLAYRCLGSIILEDKELLSVKTLPAWKMAHWQAAYYGWMKLCGIWLPSATAPLLKPYAWPPLPLQKFSASMDRQAIFFPDIARTW